MVNITIFLAMKPPKLLRFRKKISCLDIRNKPKRYRHTDRPSKIREAHIGHKISFLPMSFASQMYFTHKNDLVSLT